MFEVFAVRDADVQVHAGVVLREVGGDDDLAVGDEVDDAVDVADDGAP